MHSRVRCWASVLLALISFALRAQQFEGHVDVFDCNTFAGWAANRSNPNSPINVDIFVDGQRVATVPASNPRDDVRAYLGSQSNQFGYRFDVPVDAWYRNGQNHAVQVRYGGSGQALIGGERTYNCPGSGGGNPNPLPPGGSGNGLTGTYFGNANLAGNAVFSRVDGQIDFPWGTGGPGNGVGNDDFSVRWEGQVEAPVGGTFVFKTNNDDGTRLWVNGQLLINDWTGHAPEWRQGQLNLAAGQKVAIKLEFFEGWGGAQCQLYWEYPGQGQQIIPQSRLYASGGTTNPPAGCSFSNGQFLFNFYGEQIYAHYYNGILYAAYQDGVNGFKPRSWMREASGAVSFTQADCFAETNPRNGGGDPNPPQPPTGNCGAGAPAGHLDVADCNLITGWALDQNDFNRTLTVEIYVDGTKVGEVAANQERGDLVSAFGNNPAARLHGYTYQVPSNASWKDGGTHQITTRICGVGSSLNGAPKNVSGCTGGNSSGGGPIIPTGPLDPTVLVGRAARTAANCDNNDCAFGALPGGTSDGARLVTPAIEQGNFEPWNRFWEPPRRTLDVYRSIVSGGFASDPVDSPFDNQYSQQFFSGGPDYNEANGWMLAYKDLGYRRGDGSVVGRGMPFFALYNRYTGILRMFQLNRPQDRISTDMGFAMWRLKQWNWNCGGESTDSKRTGLMSMAATDPNYLFVDDYNGDLNEGACNPVQQVNFSASTIRWISTDFILTGYDPNNRKTVFEVTTQPFSKDSIAADIRAKLTAQGTMTSETDGKDGVKTLGEGFKSIADAFGGEDSKSKFVKDLLKAGKYLSAASSAAAVFKFALGIFGIGGSPDESVKRINISGDVTGKIFGSVTRRGQEVNKLYLGLTNDLPYDTESGLYRPVQDIPWGVFSMRRFQFSYRLGCAVQCNGDGTYNKTVYMELPDLTPNLLLNTQVVNGDPVRGMTLKDRDVALVYNSGLTSDFQPLSGSIFNVFSATVNPGESIFIPARPTPVALILKLVFTINATGKEVILTKSYPVPSDGSLTQRTRSLFAGSNSQCDGSMNCRTLSTPSTESAAAAYPNPFTESVTIPVPARPGEAFTVTAYSLTGQAIWNVSNTSGDGPTQVEWDGTDRKGQRVPAGMYLIETRLLQQGQRTQKVVLQR